MQPTEMSAKLSTPFRVTSNFLNTLFSMTEMIGAHENFRKMTRVRFEDEAQAHVNWTRWGAFHEEQSTTILTNLLDGGH